MTDSTVVPEKQDVTEAEFKAAVLTGLARCTNTPAKLRATAAAMDLSTKQVGNILNGASPGHKRMWDARAACPHVLDDVAALYGCEIVVKPDDASVGASGTVPMAGLLAQVAAAEAPDSDGGAAMTHKELLGMEADIRRVHALTAQWIKQITDLRAPRVVTG